MELWSVADAPNVNENNEYKAHDNGRYASLPVAKKPRKVILSRSTGHETWEWPRRLRGFDGADAGHRFLNMVIVCLLL